jgi:ATP-dependent Zn protease
MVDKKVQEILKQSKERVTELLMSKDIPLRNVAMNLYKYDVLDAAEIETTIKGKELSKEKVREMDMNDLRGYKI